MRLRDVRDEDEDKLAAAAASAAAGTLDATVSRRSLVQSQSVLRLIPLHKRHQVSDSITSLLITLSRYVSSSTSSTEQSPTYCVIIGELPVFSMPIIDRKCQ